MPKLPISYPDISDLSIPLYFFMLVLLCDTMHKNSVCFLVVIPNSQKREPHWPSCSQKIASHGTNVEYWDPTIVYEEGGWQKDCGEQGRHLKWWSVSPGSSQQCFHPTSGVGQKIVSSDMSVSRIMSHLPGGMRPLPASGRLSDICWGWIRAECPTWTLAIRHTFLHLIFAEHLLCTRHSA